jgi:hypothetical protein
MLHVQAFVAAAVNCDNFRYAPKESSDLSIESDINDHQVKRCLNDTLFEPHI